MCLFGEESFVRCLPSGFCFPSFPCLHGLLSALVAKGIRTGLASFRGPDVSCEDRGRGLFVENVHSLHILLSSLRLSGEKKIAATMEAIITAIGIVVVLRKQLF